MKILYPDFALPGRKELLRSEMEYKVLVIDVTETPIERPKKATVFLLWEEEKTYTKNANNYGKEE